MCINVRKLKLRIIGDKEEVTRVNNYLKNSQQAQNIGLNKCMGLISSTYLEVEGNTRDEKFKEAMKVSNNHPIFNGIEFGVGLDSKSAITQKVKKDFKASLKNGLRKGERNFINYKKDFPVMTRGRDLKFKYEEDKIIINWVNKIKFEVIVGRQDKDYEELMHTLHKIVNKEYKVAQSSIQPGRKLILNLTFEIPTKQSEYVENRTLGIDLGIKVPAVASISDKPFIHEEFGSIDDFLRVRNQFEARRRILQKAVTNCRGGKGRKKKTQALTRLRANERNWAKTYNHQLSRRIINFAISNKCQYINLEKLASGGFNNRLLRKWSYYELQEMIVYKAERAGIEVRFINPAYTSQKCSRCGYIDKESRKSQSDFTCSRCGHSVNADYNASINISRSEEYIK